MTARRRCLALALVMVALNLPGMIFAQIAPRDLRPYRDPLNRFALQYPKDWLVLPGAGSTMLTLAEKRGRATIQIEYLRLNQPLDAAQDHDLIVQIESDLIRERQMKADQIKGRPLDPATPAVVAIEFVRPGLQGPERIRQVSVVRSTDLFRMLCLASAAEFLKFERTFDQIVRSFTVVAATSDQ